MEQIQLGKQDVVFAGGGEELDWSLTMLFDAMGALSSKYNETPEQASRAFDTERDGFVISGGGGALVLESLEHAEARGATILAELTGYGATSDGYDMVAPSGEGAQRCMQLAISTVNGPIDYINAHGTSTPVGDTKELGAIKAVFGDEIPNIGSTKSLSGHALGAAGVNESIYSLLMLQNNFMAESVNIDNLDEAAEGMLIVQATTIQSLNRVMSNSFGFGGTNACLVFEKFKK
jgi:3-oxoacyl-[acyl-carrier-protein] synthase-1